METLGIDVGFGFTKASNGNNRVLFKSIIGDYADIQFRSELEEPSSTQNLQVTIEDQSYFVGDLAEQQSSFRQFTLDQSKLLTDFVQILALTAAGLCAEDGHAINVVSGLPVGYFKQDAKKFKDILTGSHQITFHQRGGGKNTKNIQINKVKMVPQPLGSLINLLMDENGKIIDRQLAKQKIGIVDIGFRTTDFILCDQLKYIDRGSSTVKNGISNCFSIIADKLRQQSGVNVELYRLYKAVRKGSIKIKGSEYSLVNLRDKVYAHAAGKLANEINRLWADDWDIDSIILTGGGSMELSTHLHPLIEGHVIPVEKGDDTRFNNVLGYIKYGKYEQKKLSVPNPTTEASANEQQEKAENKITRSKGLAWMKKNG
jgi:plasmid segregation protein ParM